MKAKKSTAFGIIICVSVCLVYCIIAAKPLGHEYQFVPKWKIDIADRISSDAQDKEKIYFKLGQSIGYFSADGKIISATSFPFKASISDYYYAPYTAEAKNTQFFTPDGILVGTIGLTGFPLFDNDRIFVFLPGGNSFAMMNDDGSTNWIYRGTIPITAFDSSESGCVAGFADGSVCTFTSNGKRDYIFSPGGSDFPIILGAAISPSGEYIAVVSGRNRQRFVLAQKDGAQAKIIMHFFVDKDDPYQKLVQFSKSGEHVFYCSTGSLGIISIDGKKHGKIQVPGQVLSIKEMSNGAFILSKENKTYTVTFVENFATFAGAFSFDANTAFIQTKDNMLFVGKDTTISHIEILKE